MEYWEELAGMYAMACLLLTVVWWIKVLDLTNWHSIPVSHSVVASIINSIRSPISAASHSEVGGPCEKSFSFRIAIDTLRMILYYTIEREWRQIQMWVSHEKHERKRQEPQLHGAWVCFTIFILLPASNKANPSPRNILKFLKGRNYTANFMEMYTFV